MLEFSLTFQSFSSYFCFIHEKCWIFVIHHRHFATAFTDFVCRAFVAAECCLRLSKFVLFFIIFLIMVYHLCFSWSWITHCDYITSLGRKLIYLNNILNLFYFINLCSWQIYVCVDGVTGQNWRSRIRRLRMQCSSETTNHPHLILIVITFVPLSILHLVSWTVSCWNVC